MNGPLLSAMGLCLRYIPIYDKGVLPKWMTGLNIKSFSYIQDTPLFLFAAVNKTSSDILKLSSFVQSISGLFCQTEVPMKTGFGWADLFL